MKKIVLLLIVLNSINCFSQSIYKTDLHERVSEARKDIIDNKQFYAYYTKKEYISIETNERNEFQALSSPDENSELSIFLRQNLTSEDLKKIDYSKIISSNSFVKYRNEIDVYRYTIRLTFEISEKNTIQNIRVNTGNHELNSKLKGLFRTFPIEKLKLTNECKTGKISIQLFAKEGRKPIIKASVNAICDESPTILGCENLKYYRERSSCFYRKLYEYILENISREVISDQKKRGEIKIQPRFSIDSSGNIFNVNSIAPNKSIKNEIDKIITSFDKTIIPAKRNGVPREYYHDTVYVIIIDEV